MKANRANALAVGIISLLVFATSFDRALAMPWSDAAVLNGNAAVDGNVGDYYPNLAHDGNGNWVCVWCAAVAAANPRDFDIYVASSHDDGATWSEPAKLDPAGADPLELEDDFHPDVYTDGDGHWIATWYSYDSRGGLYGDDIDILVSRSTDNGATWTSSVPLNSDATTDHLTYAKCSDYPPVLACDGNGHWVATWEAVRSVSDVDYEYDIYVSRSNDSGATWSALELIYAGMATDAGYDDDPTIAADTVGNWVVTWRSENLIGSNGIGDEDVVFARSTDNGVTWTAPAALNSDADTDGLRDAYSGGLDILTDGSVWVVVWVRELPPYIDYDLMISRSTDAGVTWSPVEILNPNYDVDGAAKDLYPQLATDGHSNWVVVWETYGGALPWGSDHDILYMRSEDGSLTWTSPAPVNSHAYIDLTWRDEDPSVAATEQGRWLTVWFSTYDVGGIGIDRDILFSSACVPNQDGDYDCDGDTDLVDFGAFQKCFAPSGPVAGECELFDLDTDGNVDIDDLGGFEAALIGP